MSQLEPPVASNQDLSRSSSQGTDFFKNESESVDLLLREMSADLESMAPPTTFDPGHRRNENSLSMSINTSPTKPLKFPNQHTSSKDPNSSSDTYASDQDQLHSKIYPASQNDLKSSLDRNFDIDTSADMQDTIQISDQYKSQVDIYTSQTPTTSAVNLTNKQTYTNSSPNKSIMKKPGTSSPKKVAFTATDPKIYQYAQGQQETGNEPQQSINQLALQKPITHVWDQPHPPSEDESLASPPPPPPPHTSKPTFAQLLNGERGSPEKGKKLQAVPLHEKVTPESDEEYDLDARLQELELASKNKTTENIHHLSLSLQTPKFQMENPLDSLQKSPDVQLRSSGSSQSSLQSLRDDNRSLNSVPGSPTKANRGLALRDGIKGLSDAAVESMLPRDESEDALYMNLSNSKLDLHAQPESHLDSFDNSYDRTEQSIMNLLNSASASQVGLHNVPQEKEVVIKKEKVQHESMITQERDEVRVKIEKDINGQDFASEEEQILIKQEKLRDDELLEPQVRVVVKRESNEALQSHAPTGFGNQVRERESNDTTQRTQDAMNRDHHSRLNNDITGRGESQPQECMEKHRPHTATKQTSHNETLENANLEEESMMSIRFHTDSGWKLEDSNDGDREDNDENSKVLDQSNLLEDDPSHTSSNEEFADASNELSQALEGPMQGGVKKDGVLKSLAPPRAIDEAIDATHGPKDGDTILANSSNIADANEDITLPPIETNNYSSLEDVTRNMDSVSSFEQMLSAEKDVVKPKPDNFLSIWHSQRNQKKKQMHKVPTQQLIAAYKEDQDQLKRAMSTDKVRIPSSLSGKKIKEVNVMSRRVVSPDNFDDLHLSGFLPELSRDSGFNDLHFTNQSRVSSAQLSNSNVLSNIDNNPNVVEPPQPGSYNSQRQSRRLSSSSSGHLQRASTAGSAATPASGAKRSRFRVPTFEIKRSSSVLSPKNMYDDIFEDVVPRKPPTIRAEGMKTLPSMDKDDVKRILSTRKGMTQDEYANAKFVEQKPKKNSIVTEAEHGDQHIPQTASIHDANTDSSPRLPPSLGAGADVFPYLVDELNKSPSELMSKTQPGNADYPTRTGSVLVHKKSALPEPEFEFDTSPHTPHTPHHTQSGVDELDTAVSLNYLHKENLSPRSTRQELDSKPAAKEIPQPSSLSEPVVEAKFDPNVRPVVAKPNISSGAPSTPVKRISKDSHSPMSKKSSPRKSPIKIGSPVKLVKKNGSITGIELAERHQFHDLVKVADDKPNLRNDELVNAKIRDNVNQEKWVPEHKSNMPSAVSVPSEFSDSKSQTHDGVHQRHRSDPRVIDDEHPDVAWQERGRLFFRVLGLKNINLPDMKSHKGKFTISLDNGVHCVKTPEYDLDKSLVTIGKEFELIVGDSLQFIMTMKASYTKPKGTLVEVRERKVVKSKNRIGRLFGSKDIVTTTRYVPSKVEDTWANKLATDGSFARCYVDFAQFEPQVTGIVQRFDLSCFNEWETKANGNSNGSQSNQRLKPYKIADLEVEMFFIPRSDPHEVLPTSIKSAYQSLAELSKESNLTNEGYLYQEGGDCEIWKRRWFKLYATSLVAHSEFSHKTRAKINLNKIIDVMYVDKENLHNSKHRNFSDVLLVEHSFKIKFANGEIIEFGAPNGHEMKRWVNILESIVQRNKIRRQPWINVMMKQQIGQ
ncbi:BUD4 [Candida theae]|uniref:BUD4 n=1 Tax=Candida theae TaxID=1198502 RepID=A0AAD5BAP5_9ASCO|nr:BUD4 [Candida theae]KAI5949079.1 BUD4 [Candida theae]